MKKFLKWINKHRGIVILSFIISFFLPLIVTNLLFKWYSNIWFLEAEWNAGDVLSYTAGFASLSGTIILSVLALWQNIKFQEENDKKDQLLIHIENEKIRLSNLPQFLIQTADPSKCIVKDAKLSEKYSNYYLLKQFSTYVFQIRKDNISWQPVDMYSVIPKGEENRVFSIINCGNNTAHQVKLSIDVKGQNYPFERASSVGKDQEIYFYLGIENDYAVDEDIILNLRFYDCFQNVYAQKFQIVNGKECVYLKTYSDVQLEKVNSSMLFI